MAEKINLEHYQKLFEPQFQKIVDDVLKIKDHSQGLDLIEAMRYSLLGGGKRFRPSLCLIVGEALGVELQRVVPVAAAIEFIHTSSLIHDDLPCMDNDDFRRGKPTNHKIYGEAVALLAGNSLLLEAFHIINLYYADNPEIACSLSKILHQAAGTFGMMFGQCIDISQSADSLEPLVEMQKLKTGKMIEVCVKVVAEIAKLSAQQKISAAHFGMNLGLAFQIQDDILDFDSDKKEVSIPHLIGLESAQKLLKQTSEQAIGQIEGFADQGKKLKLLVEYNGARLK